MRLEADVFVTMTLSSMVKRFQELAMTDRARCELVTNGVGFGVGVQLPRAVDEQYGFRNLPLPGKEYHVLFFVNPMRELKPEAQRYLELLDQSLADIRVN